MLRMYNTVIFHSWLMSFNPTTSYLCLANRNHSGMWLS